MRHQTKQNYDLRKRARTHKPLEKGDRVHVKNLQTDRQIVRNALYLRFYIVDTPCATVRRNRWHLVKLNQNIVQPRVEIAPNNNNIMKNKVRTLKNIMRALKSSMRANAFLCQIKLRLSLKVLPLLGLGEFQNHQEDSKLICLGQC